MLMRFREDAFIWQYLFMHAIEGLIEALHVNIILLHVCQHTTD